MSDATAIEIELASGRLRGSTTNGIDRFLGVPYAEPPFGANLFKPPLPRAPWTGIQNATAAGQGCRQPTVEIDPDPAISAYNNPIETGEDCLNLNVWAPHGQHRVPVMVWIHGGGFVVGGGGTASADGTTWARDGIVYVSINYRLHVDGFLYFDPATANLGLRDQICALQWVQDNIAAFGGDPENVTVFGQSAGAVSIAHLLSTPLSSGLFRRAIVQSGSTEGPLTIDEALSVTTRLAAMLGVSPTPEGFAAVPSEQLLAVATMDAFAWLSPANSGDGAFMISPFRPVLDGHVLPGAVNPAVASGASAEVDLMVGITHDEMTFLMHPLGLLDNQPDEWLAAARHAFGVTPEWVDEYASLCPGATLGERMASIWTDWAWRIPSIHLAEAHTKAGGATFFYEFWWRSPTIASLGASHAMDIDFSTDKLDLQRAVFVNSLHPNPLGDQAPQSLASEMHGAFVAFARTGSPGWPGYDEITRTTKIFDDPCHVAEDPAKAHREAWAGLR
jgi:para-nitrobenzyl esterase